MAPLFFNVVNTSISINIPDEYKNLISKYLGMFTSLVSKPYYFFETKKVDTIQWNNKNLDRTDYFYEERSEGKEFRLGEKEFSLDVSLDKKTAVLQIIPNTQVNIVSAILGSLKWFVSFITIENGGIPLHSSAVNNSKRSFLFLGKSGCGKSTIYSLFQNGWNKGSDEVNAVILKNGYFYSFPTPFQSSKGSSQHTSESCLTNIYFLIKSDSNKTEEITDKSELFFLLMENIYTKPASSYLAEKLMDNIQKLSVSVFCAKLFFKNDQSVCSFISKGE